MERIFQHYTGSIEELQGNEFSIVKSLSETESSDVILMWMKNKSNENWYRVFIDGAYCGVDKYIEDCSSEDIDEDIEVKDHSFWFLEKTLISATVTNINQQIILSLKFGDKTQALLTCVSQDGECNLEFID